MAKKQQLKTDPDAARHKKEEQARRARRRTRQWIGVALTFLVIVGVVSIVRTGIDVTRSLLDNSAERKEYEVRIRPLVWFDVLPFDSIDQLDQNTLKQVAIWGIIDREGSSIAKNENELPIIPTVDVDHYAKELFGKNFAFYEHGPFEDSSLGLVYEYDAENSYYIVPGTSLELAYTPTVVEIKNLQNGVKQVVVGYVSLRNTEGGVLNEPDYEHPVWYMDFFFQRDGNEYYLYAMRRNTTHVATTASSSSSSSQTVYTSPDDSSEDLTVITPPSSVPSSIPQDDTSQTDEGDSSGGSSTSETSSA